MKTIAREIDLIDVNRTWFVYVGSRVCGYSVGSVKASDRAIAMKEARAKWPNIRIGFVDEF